MASIYTVTQVNRYISQMFQQDFMLNNISVKGEISNCKYHNSGHIYFSLKDDGGVVSAVMFAGNRHNGLKFQLEEGQKVVVLGNVGVYEKDGKYQLYAKQIILEGTGLLYQRFEQLKKKLEEMGLFDSMYKKPIPAFATRIGVCTAKTGAAIQDIIHISARRNPFVQLYLYPCLVQGEGAAPDIVNAIRALDRMGLDIIIVGRGGGSIEDLWAFNEEIVAKAVFDCNTPVISAVGHETDWTITDFVADKRAATPSAAAELAVFDYYDFVEKQDHYKKVLASYMLRKTSACRSKIETYEAKIQRYNPKNQLTNKKIYLQDLSTRISEIFYNMMRDKKHRLEMYAEKLNGMSPLNRISKGFAYVSYKDGKPLNSVRQVSEEEKIFLRLRDGTITAQITDICEEQK